MHKPFYTSGFLYHVASQQILLHQSNLPNNPLSVWDIFGGTSRVGEDAQTAFQRIMYERMNIRLGAKCLFPVYDYDFNTHNIVHYVLYAEVKRLYTFPSFNTGMLSWFTFKQTAKLSFSNQTKQDVIVSERVIRAQARDDTLRALPTSADLHVGIPH